MVFSLASLMDPRLLKADSVVLRLDQVLRSYLWYEILNTNSVLLDL